MREYFYSLMSDKRSGPIAGAVKAVLWAGSFFYGIVVGVMSYGYEKKFFLPYKADPKVISVGNITVGGTGKTQVVMYLAKLLEARSKRVAILIRGYGVDEQMMLREELKECSILVGQDRIANSKRAFYDFGADTAILDDGFQHWRIARDIDIVLLDATNPFGNYRLIPRGILREPAAALKRADIIILTKTDSKSARRDEAYKVLNSLGKGSSVLEAVYRPAALRNISDGHDEGLKAINKKRVCIVSSIGNPLYFKEKISKLGAIIELEFQFMDHYNYKQEDFDKIGSECRLLGAEYIVTTKKDAVKIKRLSLASAVNTPILVLDVEFEITKNKNILNERLSGLYNSQVL